MQARIGIDDDWEREVYETGFHAALAATGSVPSSPVPAAVPDPAPFVAGTDVATVSTTDAATAAAAATVPTLKAPVAPLDWGLIAVWAGIGLAVIWVLEAMFRKGKR